MYPVRRPQSSRVPVPVTATSSFVLLPSRVEVPEVPEVREVREVECRCLDDPERNKVRQNAVAPRESNAIPHLDAGKLNAPSFFELQPCLFLSIHWFVHCSNMTCHIDPLSPDAIICILLQALSTVFSLCYCATALHSLTYPSATYHLESFI